MTSLEEGLPVNPPKREHKAKYLIRQTLGIALCLVLLVTLYILAIRLDEQLTAFAYQEAFALWHELFLILILLCCFSIGVLMGQLYGINGCPRYLVLGLTFICVGVLDLLYLFSVQGMPQLRGGGGHLLWRSARLVLAAGLIVSMLVPDKKAKRPLLVTVCCGLGYGAVFFLAMAAYGGLIPVLPPAAYFLDAWYFYLVIGLSLVGMILYLRMYWREQDASHYLMSAMALAVAGLSEVLLARGASEPIYILGHAYRLLAYLLFFQAFFVYYVQKPYRQLRETEDKLKAVVSDLERQVAQRTQAYSQANAKLLKNLEDAKSIQMALLEPDFPHFGALEFAVRYMPCEHVGGDFYRIIRLDDDHVGIFFGDVAGHGVSAAMVNVFISQNVRFKVEYEGGRYRIFTPRGVLMHLYHTYNKMSFPEEIYILIFYGIYNIRSGVLTYSSAGFNMTPMILSRDGTVRTLEMEGFPICNFGEHFRPTYKSRQVILDPKDVMVLYSDGLIEIDRKRPDLFSPQRVVECVKAYAGEGPQAVCDGLMDAYYALRGKRKILDDVTVLSIKVLDRWN